MGTSMYFLVHMSRVRFSNVFGRFLKNMRGTRSQSDIARAIGTRPHSVNEWEKGRYLPNSKHTEDLIEALGLDGIGAAHALAAAATALQREGITKTGSGEIATGEFADALEKEKVSGEKVAKEPSPRAAGGKRGKPHG